MHTFADKFGDRDRTGDLLITNWHYDRLLLSTLSIINA